MRPRCSLGRSKASCDSYICGTYNTLTSLSTLDLEFSVIIQNSSSPSPFTPTIRFQCYNSTIVCLPPSCVLSAKPPLPVSGSSTRLCEAPALAALTCSTCSTCSSPAPRHPPPFRFIFFSLQLSDILPQRPTLVRLYTTPLPESSNMSNTVVMPAEEPHAGYVHRTIPYPPHHHPHTAPTMISESSADIRPFPQLISQSQASTGC